MDEIVFDGGGVDVTYMHGKMLSDQDAHTDAFDLVQGASPIAFISIEFGVYVFTYPGGNVGFCNNYNIYVHFVGPRHEMVKF
jgi:hypothetical protein